jgi:hypothetical protein
MMNAVLKLEASVRGSHISVPVTCVARVLRGLCVPGAASAEACTSESQMFVLSPVPS